MRGVIGGIGGCRVTDVVLDGETGMTISGIQELVWYLAV